MKRPHLFCVGEPIEAFAPLVELARRKGLRVGWLALQEPSLTADLVSALESGVAQSVVAGSRYTVTARVRSGSPVVDDLLRQHFLGCDAVLVYGEVSAPALECDGSGWRLTTMKGRTHRLDSDQFLATLRRPLKNQERS